MKNFSKADSSQTHIFTSFPETHQDQDDDMTELISNDKTNNTQNNNIEQETPNEIKYSIWQVEYYQKYFNVNTTDVLQKIIGSMMPTFNQSYLINRIRPNPDLYGPFWICVTLIFTIAITGNIVNYMQNFGTDYKWHTDFHKVTSSAATILAYWWLIPTGIFMLLRWRLTESNEFSFIELLSIYGYSLFIYIPISVLWLINVSAIQWILVIIAVCLSGSVLFFTFWPAFNKDTNKKAALGITLAILLLHALLGISFMLYFFHNPNSSKIPITTTTASTITNASAALKNVLKNNSSKF